MTRPGPGRLFVVVLAGVVVVGLAVWGLVRVTHAGGSGGTGGATSTGSPSASTGGSSPSASVGSGTYAPIARFRCPRATVTVTTANELTQALATAAPGEVIEVGDGTYTGAFATSVSGTAAAPIYLCGHSGAVLQDRSLDTGYVLHLDDVAHWRVSGLTIRNAQKGVVLDASSDVGLQDLTVEHLGDEGVHLRQGSTDDVVRGLTISDTGNLESKFGEGIYVGTAKSNWAVVTDGQPDRSDRNYLVDNSISRTTAESIDIKEGTTGGVVAGNRFDGTGMDLSAATGLVNVKGNGWTIRDNIGVNAPKDGLQTHIVLAGWGEDNVFTGNSIGLADDADGYAIYIQSHVGNRVSCDNTVTGDRPLTNVSCTTS